MVPIFGVDGLEFTHLNVIALLFVVFGEIRDVSTPLLFWLAFIRVWSDITLFSMLRKVSFDLLIGQGMSALREATLSFLVFLLNVRSWAN